MLELLSCPLSHWVVKGSAKLDAEEKSDPIHEKSPDIPYVATAATPQGNDEAIDRQELNNVKLVCAQVLKGHKKLSKQLKACEEKLKLGERQAKEDVLKKMKEEQEFHFRRQLIALDMRERAFKARVKAMEERCKNHCTEQLSGWTQSMDLWKAQAEHQWKEWKVMLDHDIDVNAHFRNDVCKWMEDHQFDECQKENQHKYDDDESTPILFATNLGEVSDSTPLCNSGSSSSDTTDDSMDDPDDGDSMKSCTYPRRPFRIRRRHPWKPPVRKWDNMTI